MAVPPSRKPLLETTATTTEFHSSQHSRNTAKMPAVQFQDLPDAAPRIGFMSCQPATSEWDVPPPPYSGLEEPTPEIARLRRFLSFCLAIDYECLEISPDLLDKKELLHWAAISQLCFGVFTKARPRSRWPLLDWPKNAVHHPQIEKYILKPATALGVPAQMVFLMTRVFITALDNLYQHTLEEIVLAYGHNVLAYRIYTDRVYLFDRVLPPDSDYRARIEANNRKAEERWFEKLGPRKWTRRHPGPNFASIEGWLFSNVSEVRCKNLDETHTGRP